MKRALFLGVIGIGLVGGLSACTGNYGDSGYYGANDGYYTGRSSYYRTSDDHDRRDWNSSPIARDRAAARDPNCRATFLHQDRPGGSDYDPRLGAPSC